MSNYEKALKIWQGKHISTDAELAEALNGHNISFAYHSGKLENQNVTYHDTREIFEHDGVTSYTGDLRTLFEISNAKQANERFLLAFAHRHPLNEELVKEFQRILTRGTYDERRYRLGERPGEYKHHDYVTGRQEVGAAPEDVADEMHELIDVITEYRLTYMKLIVENLHPDAIISHDDWGTKDRMFMSPDTWREFFKEPYRKLYDYLHANDVLIVHHGDSFLEPIVEDMADIGIDVWQGVLPTNNIPEISKRLNGRMALMGGIDSGIDRQDATEEEIRKETRRACDEYGGLGHFIPSITYGGPGTLYPEVEPIIIDEIHRYNKEHFGIDG